MGILDGRKALITGSGGAMGRAAALVFAREGATIAGADVVADAAAETVELVRAAGGTMLDDTGPVDLSDEGQVRDWVTGAAEGLGGIDVVYNNAGSWKAGAVSDITAEDWHWTLGSELDSVLFVTKWAWPHLVASGAGAVVNVASVAGMIGSESLMVAHAATKGAVLAATRQMAVEGAPDGVRAVALSPGPVMSEERMEKLFATQPELRTKIPSTTLLKRFGKPEEVVEMGAFLASSRASFITGANIVVDGGLTAW